MIASINAAWAMKMALNLMELRVGFAHGSLLRGCCWEHPSKAERLTPKTAMEGRTPQ